MPEAFSVTTFQRSTSLFAAAAADEAWRAPDRHRVEDGMARAFDAIRHYARIAWWDGSSVGLHLHGYAGLFGFVEPDTLTTRRGERL